MLLFIRLKKFLPTQICWNNSLLPRRGCQMIMLQWVSIIFNNLTTLCGFPIFWNFDFLKFSKKFSRQIFAFLAEKLLETFFQTDFCCDGFMASALDSGASGSGLSPCWGHFLCWASQCLSPPRCIHSSFFYYFFFYWLFPFSFFFVNCSNNGLFIAIIAIYLLALLRDPELLQQLVETANVETWVKWRI